MAGIVQISGSSLPACGHKNCRSIPNPRGMIDFCETATFKKRTGRYLDDPGHFEVTPNFRTNSLSQVGDTHFGRFWDPPRPQIHTPSHQKYDYHLDDLHYFEGSSRTLHMQGVESHKFVYNFFLHWKNAPQTLRMRRKTIARAPPQPTSAARDGTEKKRTKERRSIFPRLCRFQEGAAFSGSKMSQERGNVWLVSRRWAVDADPKERQHCDFARSDFREAIPKTSSTRLISHLHAIITLSKPSYQVGSGHLLWDFWPWTSSCPPSIWQPFFTFLDNNSILFWVGKSAWHIRAPHCTSYWHCIVPADHKTSVTASNFHKSRTDDFPKISLKKSPSRLIWDGIECF